MAVGGFAPLARLVVIGVLAASAALAGTPAVAAPTPAGSSATGATVAFHLDDPRLDEISGIAAGIRSPGVVYVENDGGDAARLFALDARSGAVRAVYTVPGARNVDWEDIAVARNAHGTPSVWLADIGDNDAQRRQIRLYRVDEPRVDAGARGVSLRSSPPQVWRLTYPGGPHNAESLAVSPAGVPYIVTKSLLGASIVYAAATTPGTSTLRRVGSIRFTPTGTPGPFAPVGQLTATGAAFSHDGRAFVVRTYTDAYVWRVADGDLKSALRSAPTRLALPSQPQGEGVCFRGDHLMIDSEHVGSAVYSVPLPAGFRTRPVRSPSPPPSPSPSSVTRAPSAPQTSTPAPQRTSASAASGDDDRDGPSGWGWALAAAAVTSLIAVGLGLRGRRR